MSDNTIFAMYRGGITSVTTDAEMRALAASDPNGNMQPFFATAIVALMEMMQRGELVGVTPADLYIGIVKRA